MALAGIQRLACSEALGYDLASQQGPVAVVVSCPYHWGMCDPLGACFPTTTSRPAWWQLFAQASGIVNPLAWG